MLSNRLANLFAERLILKMTDEDTESLPGYGPHLVGHDYGVLRQAGYPLRESYFGRIQVPLRGCQRQNSGVRDGLVVVLVANNKDRPRTPLLRSYHGVEIRPEDAPLELRQPSILPALSASA